VEENSAAAKAGLKENDVILEVNGKPVEDVEDFIHTIAASAPGTKVNLTIWRGGAKKSMTAVLESRPVNTLFGFPDGTLPPMPTMPSMDDGAFPGMIGIAPHVGFEGETLSPQLAAYFGVKEGVLVRTVEPRTPAEKAGLKAGDVVIKVNGTPVANPREISGVVRANRSNKSASFTVVRDKKEIALSVQIVAQRQLSPGHDIL
jgi:serine protease Do